VQEIIGYNPFLYVNIISKPLCLAIAIEKAEHPKECSAFCGIYRIAFPAAFIVFWMEKMPPASTRNNRAR
jgi:hypothetical protein